MHSVQSGMYDGPGHPSTDDMSQLPAMSTASTNEIVKGSRVTFKESAHVLQRIVEFMYLGEIADLEEGKNSSSEDDYNLWMWLLTWYAQTTFLHGLHSCVYLMAISWVPLCSNIVNCFGERCRLRESGPA